MYTLVKPSGPETGYFGTPFAIGRYTRYASCYEWKSHSIYRGYHIERCYDGTQPKACYRALDLDGHTVITGEGLAQVKAAITEWKNNREEYE